METATIDLATLLARIAAEARQEKANKRTMSHRLAKGFVELLEREGIRVLEMGPGNANYFCTEINGMPVGVSPFASHDEWWDKVSDGFRAMIRGRGCRWGVVLFRLPENKGIWLEGPDYDANVLKGHETVHSLDVRNAKKSGIAHTFSHVNEFVALIRDGPPSRPKSILIRRRR